MGTAVAIDIKRIAPRTWQECLARFLALRSAEGAAERTLQGYRESIELFFARYPSAWSATAAVCIASFLGQKNISVATYNLRLKSLRPFFAFAAREGAFTESPAAVFKYRRGQQPRVVDHSLDDMRKVLGAIGTDTFAGLRDAALFLFSLDSGIRPSEALALRPSDVDTRLRRAIVRAATSKTLKGRTVYFSPHTASMIDRLMDARPEEWGEDTPLFCTSYGDRWNTHGWTVQLRRYAVKAGLKRFSAYDLRHQYALEALRGGMDVFSLQRTMGHTTLTVTQGYIALSDSDLAAAHEKASPVAAMLPSPRKRAGSVPPRKRA